jgi:hypothetical protein
VSDLDSKPNQDWSKRDDPRRKSPQVETALTPPVWDELVASHGSVREIEKDAAEKDGNDGILKRAQAVHAV